MNGDQLPKEVPIGLLWDQLWRQLKSQETPALWDVPPSQAVGKDMAIFKDTFDPALPLIDSGVW